MTINLLEDRMAKTITLCRVGIELVVTHQAPWLERTGVGDMRQSHAKEK